MNKKAAWFMIICSMSLMQWHGVHFWKGETGDWISGVGISFCLEIAMLSLWYAGRGWFLWFAKWIAAFLLVAGAWYQITSPTFHNIQIGMALHDKIEIVRDEVETLKQSLATYEGNSKKRRKWAGRIDKTRAELKASRAELKGLIDKRAAADPKWTSASVPRMVAAALFIIITAQLFSITSLRPRNVTTVTEDVTPKRNGRRNVVTTEYTSERYEATVKAVVEEITRREKKLGSRAEICRQTGIRPEYVTAVMNHEEKKKSGSAITPNGLKKIVDALGVVV